MGALLGAVEAGGTKFVCAISRGPEVLAQATIPTRDPAATIADVATFFASHRDLGPIAATGIAAFGPVDVDTASPRWGHILDTPKRAWVDFDLAGSIAAATGAPVLLEADVGAAALAEAQVAGPEALVAYATIGTGIGIGFAQGGRVIRGRRHPEGGHIRIVPHPAMGPSTCPFHGDCLDGLACGLAVSRYWGAPLHQLPADHPGHDAIADALAQMAHAFYLTLAPDRIVIGGGVMTGGHLLPRIRAGTLARLRGYYLPPGDPGLEAMITGPRSGNAPGLIGALLLAARAL